ncbi:MAG TPA: ATP phosphoribosyltransferase regulatory subunit [Candidatus Fimadaptatus faecigallinarum]|uniref:ATP phosphoribosyltransferase regulatory subunit n=1 Tax=Candidatus Fimadaptatus faecigallinarum TaxID=2840814 RepID=A0A9D1S5M6_9FIRM|nr:ATP phosphoribosyltransferase regulatory subunit [Candidatus Fimadaptatus faecigallinarum]
MARLRLYPPEGMQDYLPDERWHKRRVEAQVREQFALSGYEEIETSMLEYCDVVSGGEGRLPAEQLFKTFDQRGSVLAVRPDNTLPIARLIAGHAREMPAPVRVSYVQDIVQYPLPKGGQMRAHTQAGIELMGEGGAAADAEVIAVAIRALRASGLRQFQIDIGQVEYFKGLMEEAGLTGDTAERLRVCVEEKNSLAIELMKSRGEISEMAAQRLRELPGLYGGEEVLDAAEALSSNARCRAAVRNLRDILAMLRAYELDGYISIDLGMVHSIDYYTGMIFRGLTGHLGYPLLSGGRYDELMAQFGRPMAATGFALSVKPLLVALEREGGMLKRPAVDWMLAFTPDGCQRALRLAESLRAQGLSVRMCYQPERLEEQARAAGCRDWKLIDGGDAR